MDNRNKQIGTLVSLGLTRRATMLLFVFITAFLGFIIAFILLISKESILNLILLSSLVPLILFDIFLGYYGLSEKFQESFTHEENLRKTKKIKEQTLKKSSLGRKAYVGMACYGSAVGIGILIICLSLIIGMEEYLFEIFASYIFLGIPLLYLILAPILQRKLD